MNTNDTSGSTSIKQWSSKALHPFYSFIQTIVNRPLTMFRLNHSTVNLLKCNIDFVSVFLSEWLRRRYNLARRYENWTFTRYSYKRFVSHMFESAFTWACKIQGRIARSLAWMQALSANQTVQVLQVVRASRTRALIIELKGYSQYSFGQWTLRRSASFLKRAKVSSRARFAQIWIELFVFHRVKLLHGPSCTYARLAKEKQKLVFRKPETRNNSESNLGKTVTEMAPKTLRINKQ